MMMAFAVAVQAGEGKACKDKAACADKAKAISNTQAKAECCSGAKATVAKKVLMSPKAMSLASK